MTYANGRSVYDVEPGEPVRIRDASGDWHTAIAATAIEPTHRDGRKVHDFPVVWVDALGRDGETHRMPWPSTDVLPCT